MFIRATKYGDILWRLSKFLKGKFVMQPKFWWINFVPHSPALQSSRHVENNPVEEVLLFSFTICTENPVEIKPRWNPGETFSAWLKDFRCCRWKYLKLKLPSWIRKFNVDWQRRGIPKRITAWCWCQSKWKIPLSFVPATQCQKRLLLLFFCVFLIKREVFKAIENKPFKDIFGERFRDWEKPTRFGNRAQLETNHYKQMAFDWKPTISKRKKERKDAL